MIRAAILASLLAAIAFGGCEKSSEAPQAGQSDVGQGTAGKLELGGIALGGPLGSSPLAEQLKKANPTIGPTGQMVGGTPIIFARVQLNASSTVEALYLKFDEEDYATVKRALGEKYQLACASGQVERKPGRQVEDELCVYTNPTGSLALRRRDNRSDTSSVGIIAAALGRPQLEGAFDAKDKSDKQAHR